MGLSESFFAQKFAITEQDLQNYISEALSSGGEYADLSEFFCTAARCPVIVGNTLVYRDDNHVTIEYAQLLGPLLAEIVDRGLAA